MPSCCSHTCSGSVYEVVWVCSSVQVLTPHLSAHWVRLHWVAPEPIPVAVMKHRTDSTQRVTAHETEVPANLAVCWDMWLPVAGEAWRWQETMAFPPAEVHCAPPASHKTRASALRLDPSSYLPSPPPRHPASAETAVWGPGTHPARALRHTCDSHRCSSLRAIANHTATNTHTQGFRVVSSGSEEPSWRPAGASVELHVVG